MENKSKLRIISIALVLLVLLNGVTLFMLVRQNSGNGNEQNPRHERPEDYLVRAAGFDADQEKLYREMAASHKSFLDSMQPHCLGSRADFFSLMATDEPDSVWQTAQLKMEDCRHLVDARTFAHFRKVKELCRAEQLPDFEEAVKELSRRPPPKPSGEHHGNKPGRRP